VKRKHKKIVEIAVYAVLAPLGLYYFYAWLVALSVINVYGL
jgi:hypothetical protein